MVFFTLLMNKKNVSICHYVQIFSKNVECIRGEKCPSMLVCHTLWSLFKSGRGQ